MERRITAEVGTVPLNFALAGTVTSNADQTILSYTGSNDVQAIYTAARINSVDSTYWIYVHGITPFLARVTGMSQLSNNNWQIFLDRNFPGAAGAACSWLKSAVQFGILNDGGADANIMSGEKNSALIDLHTAENPGNRVPYFPYSDKTKLHAPMYIDATNTDVLIYEEI